MATVAPEGHVATEIDHPRAVEAQANDPFVVGMMNSKESVRPVDGTMTISTPVIAGHDPDFPTAVATPAAVDLVEMVMGETLVHDVTPKLVPAIANEPVAARPTATPDAPKGPVVLAVKGSSVPGNEPAAAQPTATTDVTMAPAALVATHEAMLAASVAVTIGVTIDAMVVRAETVPCVVDLAARIRRVLANVAHQHALPRRVRRLVVLLKKVRRGALVPSGFVMMLRVPQRSPRVR